MGDQSSLPSPPLLWVMHFCSPLLTDTFLLSCLQDPLLGLGAWTTPPVAAAAPDNGGRGSKMPLLLSPIPPKICSVKLVLLPEHSYLEKNSAYSMPPKLPPLPSSIPPQTYSVCNCASNNGHRLAATATSSITLGIPTFCWLWQCSSWVHTILERQKRRLEREQMATTETYPSAG